MSTEEVFVVLVIGFLLLINLVFWVISVAKKLKNKPITTAYVCNIKPKEYWIVTFVTFIVGSSGFICYLGIEDFWEYVLPWVVAIILGTAYPIYVINGIKEKKYDHIRITGATTGRALCEGWASVNGNGGWMFLTENSFEMYLYPIRVSRQSIIIDFANIKKTTSKGNTLIIDTYDGVYRFKVKKIKEWKKYIKLVFSLEHQ